MQKKKLKKHKPKHTQNFNLDKYKKKNEQLTVKINISKFAA